MNGQLSALAGVAEKELRGKCPCMLASLLAGEKPHVRDRLLLKFSSWQHGGPRTPTEVHPQGHYLEKNSTVCLTQDGDTWFP